MTPLSNFYFGINQDERNLGKFHFVVAFAYGERTYLLSSSAASPTRAWSAAVEFIRRMIAEAGKAVS